MKYVFLLIATVYISLPAYAEFKIATVDVNRVLNESKEAQSKRKDLDQKSTDVKKKLDDREKALHADEKRLKDANVAENSKEAEKFRADARDFGRMVKDAEDDLKKDFLRFNKTIAEKAVKIVTAYAKTNNIDLVLDKGDKTRGPVLFGDSSFDITDSIIREMNQ